MEVSTEEDAVTRTEKVKGGTGKSAHRENSDKENQLTNAGENKMDQT